MLLWIELKRCHGILIAPLVAALAIWMIRQNDLRDGVVLWSEVSREVYDITWMMSAFGAAFAAWVVGRSQRRRIDTQEDTSAIPVGRVSLIAIVAASIWMFASYLVVFTYMAIPAIRFATWDGPEWPVLALGALAIVVPVMVGGLVGQFGRSILVPPVVLVAVLALNVFASDSGRKYQEATLIPLAFKPTFDNSIGISLPTTLMWTYALFLVAFGLVAVAILLLIRQKSALRIVLGMAALIVAFSSAGQVLSSDLLDYNTLPERTPDETAGGSGQLVAYDPVCEVATSVEVCVHPAFSSLLDDVVAAANAVFPQLAGLSGVPVRIEQYVGQSFYQDPEAFDFALWDRHSAARAVAMLTGNIVAGGGSFSSLTASQCVITAWLTRDLEAGPTCVSGLIRESRIGENQTQAKSPELASAGEAQLQAKVDSFAALGPEPQRAWLESNWDALRAGEISLEEMP
jgi:hypothetical protein